VTLGERLFVGSFGDVYELASGQWKKVLDGAIQQQGHGGKLWALTPTGVVEYDPATGARKTHTDPKIAEGRFTGMLVTDTDLWITAEPLSEPKSGQPPGGGVGRLDLATNSWQCWKALDGLDACHAVVQAGQDGAVWVMTHQGKYQVLAAHPGMTHVEKTLFNPSSFGLHRWDAAKTVWQTTPLTPATLEKRFICGQDGRGSDDEIALQNLERLCVAPDRLFAVTRLMPRGVFSGYWPSVNSLAVRRPDGTWNAQFEHHPEQLDLQGEQPLVLNISNKGEMILKAVGHPAVLDLFRASDATWSVTERAVGWFDSSAGTWRKILTLDFNFYWRPTAVLDEGKEVFVGSDRGLISRLDLDTGWCQALGGLKDRTIDQIVRRDGRLLVSGERAPLGRLPVSMRGPSADWVDADVAVWDGKIWKPETAARPEAPPMSPWEFRPVTPPKRRGPFLREMHIGNMLWGAIGAGAPAPCYYVKEVYAPAFLDFGQDGKRMWISTFTGLLKVDLPDKEKTK